MNDKDIELIIYNQLVTELKNHGITKGVKAGLFPEDHISGEDFIAFYPAGAIRGDYRQAPSFVFPPVTSCIVKCCHL
ncbi:hypothetical protein [Morganella morganii]|uniref:hypothetical protein n=1 Tax=Morganella morganii TaxID=582 RepID=UPI000412960C|nr:hypothetical protein [Morganella morganii]MBT0309302.1 hypothetical protein [Morganella morganii subsp. morganii]MQC11518.1 hypothetical protein [Morganella morganii]MQC14856.1 hypothetical protein [Morganella morganii]QQU42780.1 hypothetical protein I6I42_09395 [Morganella morganii]GIZ28697.1 hypothetical protein TUM12149_26670 [Morganella morganii]